MVRPQNNEDSPLEELEERLYAREDIPAAGRSRLKDRETTLAHDWEHAHTLPHDRSTMTPTKKGKWAKLFLICSIVFFVVAVGVAALIISRGGNTISSSNLELAVTGPVSVDAGDTLELDITVTNGNNATLETADLFIEFPSGTRNAEDVRTELQRVQESLGSLSSGEIVRTSVESVVFGEQDEEQEIIVTVEYRVSGSNAIFMKEKAFTYVIGNTPLTLLIDAPAEVNAGQRLETTLTLISNSTNVLEDVVVVADYPFGFSFLDSDPETSQGDRVWRVGDIPAGSRRTISVEGTIEGQDEEERTLRFTAGIADPDDPTEIATPFLIVDHTLAIRRPFVETTITMNGSANEEVAVDSMEQVRVDIAWHNNLPTQVADVEFEVELSGIALNKSSVSADRGFYRSSSNTIRWDGSSDPRLDLMEPGATGQVAFTFRSEDIAAGAPLEEPEIFIAASLRARRLGDRETASDIVSDLGERVVRVNSVVAFSSEALYADGPFDNTGPMPPRAEEETTYTVVWRLSNSSNAIENARVTATLPSYVQWMDSVRPASEDITFNSVGGEIVWNVGMLPAGTGYGQPVREGAFQISFTPSLSQVGQTPNLMSAARLQGRDTFTGVSVSQSAAVLTTRLSTDSGFSEFDARVTD